MNQFLKNIFGVILCTLGVLVIMDVCVTYGLRKSHAPSFDSMTSIFHGNIYANLIINGNSQGRHQIDPQILNSVLSVQAYNISQDGTNIQMQNLLYDLYRQHNEKPGYILHVVNAGIFEKEDGLPNHMKFAPYLDNNLVRHATINSRGFHKIDYYVPFIRYAGYPKHIANGMMLFLGGVEVFTDDQKSHKGYYPIDHEWNVKFERFKNKHPEGIQLSFYSPLMTLMEDYIQACKKENIKLLFVIPPIYHEALPYLNNNDEILTKLKDLAKKHNIVYLDYQKNIMSYHRDNYFDHMHFNQQGAEAFTRKLSLDLKSLDIF